jgi:hypothetical protein
MPFPRHSLSSPEDIHGGEARPKSGDAYAGSPKLCNWYSFA